jgi:1,4-dihydroxy-2-naphthoyl-CoA hydrolase
MKLRAECTPDYFYQQQKGTLCDWFDFRILSIAQGHLRAKVLVRPEMLAPNGFLHAASVIAIADSATGFAALAHLPDGAKNMTTIELKSNFLGTVKEGEVSVVASANHLGRMTQVWDAEVFSPEGKKIALFRCTQMILW